MIKIEIISKKTDKLLNILSSQIEGLSYSSANKILRKKDVRINNKKVSDNLSVNIGEKISVFLPDNYKDSLTEDKFFNVEYDDENIIVVNKYAGIETSSPTENITVEKFLSKNKKIYPLYKLDRNTEGLIIFTKTRNLLDKLKKAIKQEELEVIHIAEVVGTPKWKNFTAINYFLKDKETNRIRIFDTPSKDSKKFVTEISVLSNSAGGTSVFVLKINNDNLHEMRAHLSHIGHPIIGDSRYGKNEYNKKFKAKTQRLTSYKIVFNFTTTEFKYLNEKNIEIHPSWIK